jgi:hypothetical protein
MSTRIDAVELRCSPNGWMTMLVGNADAPAPDKLGDVLVNELMTAPSWYPLSRTQVAVVYTDSKGRRIVSLDAHEAGPRALSALPHPFRLGLAWRHEREAKVNINWWPRAEVFHYGTSLHGPELLITVAPSEPNRISGDVRGAIRGVD